MAEVLWKDCAEWLVQCQVLSPDHRVTWPSAELIDFARTLQDGSLLCQLLHTLKPGCLDLREAHLQPQTLSEFLCQKNICLFLETCQKHFGLRESQLFEPAMLYELTDFLKVLQCLSELSKAQPVKARGFPSFPPADPVNAVEYYNIDKYRRLDELAGSQTEDDLDLFQSGSSKREAGIYEDLCYIKLPARELPEPQDKREYCIRELHDTERNYVDALKMIVDNFMAKIQSILSTDDLLAIFVNIQDLLSLHKKFYSDLRSACFSQNRVGRGLLEAFKSSRMKFTQYGRYCASLQKAQWHLDNLCARNEAIDQAVKKCQNETNDGKFRLRDLLSVPMQRILKYHLLLRELKKHSSNTPEEDQAALHEALEIMIDIAVYINEVKRDSEMIETIKKIESSVSDCKLPDNAHLTAYGRYLIDGQVRFKPHEAPNAKTRHIFLFDRVMLIVKPTKNTYSYKNALAMSDHLLDETIPQKPVRGQWNHLWYIYNCTDNRVAYTMAVKTGELREKWISAIKLALDNLQPPGLAESDHSIVYSTFDQPTLCSVCKKLLRGQFFQGYSCTKCQGAVHKECIPNFKGCGKPVVPARTKQSLTGTRGIHRHSTAGHTTMSSSKPQPPPRAMSFAHYGSSNETNGSRLGSTPESVMQSNASTLAATSSTSLNEMNSGQENVAPEPRSETLQVHGTNFPFSPLSPGPGNGHFVYNVEDQALVGQPWFAGTVDREKAEEILNKFPNGTFLVRISSKADAYKAISVRYDDKVRHIKIFVSPDGTEFFLAPQKVFKDILELISWYEKNSLNNSFQGMNTNLKTPYKRAILRQETEGPEERKRFSSSFAAVSSTPQIESSGETPKVVVRYDFSATSANMLTIKVGDVVEVLSRNGEERGWWKGRCNGKIGYFPFNYVEEMS